MLDEAIAELVSQFLKEKDYLVYCLTQGEVKPPPLGGGFSVSFVGCGHEQLSQRLPQCFFNSPAPGLDNQVPEKDFVRRHRPEGQVADTRYL